MFSRCAKVLTKWKDNPFSVPYLRIINNNIHIFSEIISNERAIVWMQVTFSVDFMRARRKARGRAGLYWGKQMSGIKKKLFRTDKVKHAQKLIPMSYEATRSRAARYVARSHRSTRMWLRTDLSVIRHVICGFSIRPF